MSHVVLALLSHQIDLLFFREYAFLESFPFHVAAYHLLMRFYKIGLARREKVACIEIHRTNSLTLVLRISFWFARRNTEKAEHIATTLYSPSCLGQEKAKGPFGLRVKLPPAHLFTTHGGGFTLSIFIAERQAGKP